MPMPYFDTPVHESKGKIIHDFCVFLICHKRSTEACYVVNKGIFPKALLAETHAALAHSAELFEWAGPGLYWKTHSRRRP